MNNTPNAASAVPAWIQENLPKYLIDRPATTEALWAGSVSASHVLVVVASAVFAAADTVGADESLSMLGSFVTHFHFLPVVIGVFFPAIASSNAFGKAKQGASAS